MRVNKSKLPASTKTKSRKINFLYITPYNSESITSRNSSNNFNNKNKSFVSCKSTKNPLSTLTSKLYWPNIKSTYSNKKEKNSKNFSDNKIKCIKNSNSMLDKTIYSNEKYYTINNPKNCSFISQKENTQKNKKKSQNIFESSRYKKNNYSTELLSLKKGKNFCKKNIVDYSNIKTNNNKICEKFSNSLNFQEKDINKMKKINVSLNNNNKFNVKSDKNPKILKKENKNENIKTNNKKIKDFSIESLNNIKNVNDTNLSEAKSELNKEINTEYFQPDFKVKSSYEKYKNIIISNKKKSNKNENICDFKIPTIEPVKTFDYKDNGIEKEKQNNKKAINIDKTNDDEINIPYLISNVEINNYEKELNDKKYKNYLEFYTQNTINTREIINDPIEEVEEAKEDSEMPNISTDNKILRMSNYKNLSNKLKNSKSQEENRKINQTSIYDKMQIYRKNLLSEIIDNNHSYNGNFFKYTSFKNKIGDENNKKTINLKKYKYLNIKNDNTNLYAQLRKNKTKKVISMKKNKILKNNYLIDNNKNELGIGDVNSTRSSGIHTMKEKLGSNTNTTSISKNSIDNNNYFEKRKKIIKSKNIGKSIYQSKNLYGKIKIFKKIINKIDINRDMILTSKVKKYESFNSMDKKCIKDLKNKSSKLITTNIKKGENYKNLNKSVNIKRHFKTKSKTSNNLLNVNLK